MKKPFMDKNCSGNVAFLLITLIKTSGEKRDKTHNETIRRIYFNAVHFACRNILFDNLFLGSSFSFVI